MMSGSEESYLLSSSDSLTESTSDSEADSGVTGGPVQPLIPVRATRTRRLRGGTRRRRWPNSCRASITCLLRGSNVEMILNWFLPVPDQLAATFFTHLYRLLRNWFCHMPNIKEVSSVGLALPYPLGNGRTQQLPALPALGKGVLSTFKLHVPTAIYLVCLKHKVFFKTPIFPTPLLTDT